MKIKEVSSNDLNEIYSLEKKVFDKNAFSKDLIKKLIRTNTFFLKIETKKIRKEILGFIIVVKDQIDRVNIINFLINPKYHHKGYGTYLLQRTIQKIKELNKIKKIVLNVQLHNLAAINLYRKFGFEILEKIENYYQSKEDAYLMEMKLL